MRGVWVAALCLSFLTLSACDRREAELRRLWKAAERENTVMAYLGFLAEQAYDEDVEIDPDFYDREGRTRRGKAIRAIRSLGRDAARASCGFGSIEVALDQQIEGIDLPLRTSSRLGGKFSSLGIDLADAGGGERVLHLKLRGKGAGQFYGVAGSYGQHRVTGGQLHISAWFASTPEIVRQSSSVNLRPTESAWIDPNKLQDGPIKQGIPDRLLDDARLEDVIAHLLFDVCGPAASALFYLNNRPAGAVRDSDLEMRFRQDGHAALDFLIGASLSTTVYDGEHARLLVMAVADRDEATLFVRARHNLKRPERVNE